MKTLLKNWRDESGQAVIEYVLILTVTVGVILGGLYQLNSAFRVWADNYFGDYLACLIESGELPTFGGTGGECNQLFKSFSLADGRGLNGSDISGGTGDGSGNPNEGGGEDDESAGAGGSGSGRSSVQGRRSSSEWASSSKRFRVTRAQAGASEEEGSQMGGTGSASVTDLSGYESGRAVRIPLRSASAIGRGRKMRDDDEDKEKKTKVVGSTTGGPTKTENALMRVERRVAQAEAPDIEEFTFGKLFRYLLIAAIVIAILLFIGGQALQVSKSMD